MLSALVETVYGTVEAHELRIKPNISAITMKGPSREHFSLP